MGGEASRINGRKGGRGPGPRGKLPKTLAKEAGQRAYLEAEGISAARVLEEYRRVAFGDIAELYDDEGRLLPIRQMPRPIRDMLASVKSTKKNLTSGDGVQEDVVEIKRWDKIRALDSLAKHLGLLVDRVDVSGAIDLKTMLDFLDLPKRRNREPT